MGPFIFAVFVVCTPDLLICNNTPSMTTMHLYDLDGCKAHVKVVIEKEYKDTDVGRHDNRIRMGTCVWRIITK